MVVVHHLLVFSQYMGGRPFVKIFRRCGLGMGEKKSILEFLLRLLWRECFARMAFLPKEVNIGGDHLKHAIGVGVESSQSLSVWGEASSEVEENKTVIFFSWK